MAIVEPNAPMRSSGRPNDDSQIYSTVVRHYEKDGVRYNTEITYVQHDQ
jgi:hypothetical protein